MATLDITYDSPTSLSLTIDSTSNQLEITQVLARGAEGKGYDGVTSSTSLTISAETKAFSVNKQGAFVSGARIRLISAANPSNWMEGIVTITDGTSWSLHADTVGGSGTYASWTVSLAGNPGASGESNTASNLGSTGARVFADKNGVDLRFRRIVAGTNVTVTENPNDLTIAATSDGSVTSVALSGTDGVSVSGSPITGAGTITLGLGNITPDSVAATGNVTGANLSGTNTGDQTITLSGDVSGSGTGSITTTLANSGVTAATYGSSTQIPVIAVDAKGRVTSASNQSISVGEVNTASNLGVSGGRVFSDKSGTDLRFRRIVAGSNITVTENANDLTIASTASGGEANTASNLGSTGARIFADKSGVDLRFRRLTAGTNITLTENSNTIAIDAEGGGVSAFADLVDVDFDPVADVGKTYIWNGFLMVPSERREVLTSDREYFVRTDGNDSNSGATNSAGGAFLTWQKAIDVYSNLDQSIYNVAIKAGGTGSRVFTITSILQIKKAIGTGFLILEGNPAAPSEVSIRRTTSATQLIENLFNTRIRLSGLTLDHVNTCFLNLGGFAYLSNCRLIGANLLVNSNSGGITCIEDCTVASGGGAAFAADRGGRILLQKNFPAGADANVITVTGTPAFSTAFALSNNPGSMIVARNTSFSGSATGLRYTANDYSKIDTLGAGATYFPGNANGTVSNGIYV